MLTAIVVIAMVVAFVVWLISFEWLFLAVAGTFFFLWTMVDHMQNPRHRRR